MTKPLHQLDLNLLLTLQLLLQERSVSRVAKKLSLTSSSVSKSLTKLRHWFDDPLFIRTPKGFEPTPFALTMEQELKEWQQLTRLLVSQRSAEIPSDSVFNLAIESPLLLTMFSQLTQNIYHHYPDATVRLTPWEYDSVEAIVRGDVDIGFSGRESHHRSKELVELLPELLEHETIFVDTPRVYLRDDHPALKQQWTLATMLDYPHIAIRWEQRERWALDEVLADLGEARRCPLVMSTFEQSLFMAAQKGHDFIAIAPSYCRHYIAQQHSNLVSLSLPLSKPDLNALQIRYALMWHSRNRHNPKVAWLRAQLERLYQNVGN